jgi:hypothetical protein
MKQAPDARVVIAESQKTLAQTVLTDIETGLTFLEVAETTTDRNHALKSIGNATTALAAAGKYLPQLPPDLIDVEVIREHREQLAQRLRAVTDLIKTGRR